MLQTNKKSIPSTISSHISTKLQMNVSGPTELFNMDIARIIKASQNNHPGTINKNCNQSVHIVQHHMDDNSSNSNKSNKEAMNEKLFYAASEAHDMLQQMIDLYKSGHKTARPNRETFLLVMRAYHDCSCIPADIYSSFSSNPSEISNYNYYSNSPSREEVYLKWNHWDIEKNIVRLHKQMIDLYDEEREQEFLKRYTTEADEFASLSSSLSPTIETFNLVLSLTSRRGNTKEVEDILTQMKTHQITPIMDTWAYVIKAWSFPIVTKSFVDETEMSLYIEKMNNYVGSMEGLYNSTPNLYDDMDPNRTSMRSDAKSHEEMEKDASLHNHRYLLEAYQTITNTLSRIHVSSSLLHTAAENTEATLNRMKIILPLNVLYSNPSFVSNIYTSNIMAWCRQVDKGHNTKYSDGEYIQSQQNHSNENTADSKKMAIAHKATDALLQFIQLCIKQQWHLQRFELDSLKWKADEEETFMIRYMEPPIIAFNGVISSWARCCSSDDLETLEYAESIFQVLQAFQANQKYSIDPTMIASSINVHDSRLFQIMNELNDNDNPLHFHVEPDVFTYNSMINAVRKSCSSATFTRNQYHHNRGHMPQHKIDRKEISTKISFLMQHMQNANIVPDDFTYSTAIDAYIRCGAPTTYAQMLLTQMEEQFIEQQQQEHWRSRSSSKHGDTVILSPNVKHYSLVMNRYAKEGQPEKAQELLNRMELLYQQTKNDNLKPDVISYTTVIEAWGKSQRSDRGERALDVLKKMMKHKRSSHDDDNSNVGMGVHVEPTVRTFAAVILTLAKQRIEGNAQKAYDLLGTMNEMNITPNIYTFNNVINACANAPEIHDKNKLFRMAALIFKLLHSREYLDKYSSISENNNRDNKAKAKANHDVKHPSNKWKEAQLPDSYTYAFFIKACTRLLPLASQRKDLVRKAFQLSCKNGQVSEEVLYFLRRSGDMDFCAEVMDVHLDDVMSVKVEDLQREWSCNIRSKKRSH